MKPRALELWAQAGMVAGELRFQQASQVGTDAASQGQPTALALATTLALETAATSWLNLAELCGVG